ncbi:MAG: phosphodiester glycosidase family protein [Pyrinomonadaceae bacterium]
MRYQPPRNNEFVLCLLFLLVSASSVSRLPTPAASAQTAAAPRSTQSQQSQTVAPGIEYLQVTRGTATLDESTGPWSINLLRVDLNRARVEVVHALDEGVGLETVSSIAARHQAVAAVNSGYFRTTGTFRGESVGVLLLKRKLISEPHNDRAAVGFIKSATSTEVVFGHLKFSAKIAARGSGHAVAGFNRPLARDELILFTPEFHRTTLTTPEGVEAVVRKGRVSVMRDLYGSSEIPGDGFVVSAVGSARQWLTKNLRRGSRLVLSAQLIPIDSKQADLWRRAETIVGGGPQLVKDGKIAITNEQEKIAPAFVSDRHPRTAIAKLRSGKLLLVTVDGRQPGISVGMSLTTLADLLLEFGAVEAINLDGGGSTTMIVHNRVVNRPSDSTGERPVSDAILIFSRTNEGKP